jgi:carbon storage regulator CsrA
MLVLSRRSNERIVFPSLGITAHMLKLSGSGARVGIEAPPEVTVLRDELCATSAVPGSTPARKGDPALANALSKITQAIHLARKQSQAGRSADADATLETAPASLEALEPARRQPAPASPRCRALIVEDDANEREPLAGVFSVSSTSPREWNIPDGSAGFDAWFSKPLNPRRLWDAMQASLGSPAPAHAH